MLERPDFDRLRAAGLLLLHDARGDREYPMGVCNLGDGFMVAWCKYQDVPWCQNLEDKRSVDYYPEPWNKAQGITLPFSMKRLGQVFPTGLPAAMPPVTGRDLNECVWDIWAYPRLREAGTLAESS